MPASVNRIKKTKNRNSMDRPSEPIHKPAEPIATACTVGRRIRTAVATACQIRPPQAWIRPPVPGCRLLSHATRPTTSDAAGGGHRRRIRPATPCPLHAKAPSHAEGGRRRHIRHPTAPSMPHRRSPRWEAVRAQQ